MSRLRADWLVGSWELVGFTVTPADGGPVRQPFGPGARGRIVYAADGHMAALLSAADRPPVGPGGLERAHKAPAAAKAQAFDTALSYSGRWRLVGDTVHHEVDLALVPEVVGTTQIRRARPTADGGLVLDYQLTDRRGGVHTFALRWRRAAAPCP